MKLNEIIVCVVTDIGISFGMLIKFDIVEKMAEKKENISWILQRLNDQEYETLVAHFGTEGLKK